jgi:hypothetical protein
MHYGGTSDDIGVGNQECTHKLDDADLSRRHDGGVRNNYRRRRTLAYRITHSRPRRSSYKNLAMLVHNVRFDLQELGVLGQA